MMVIVGYKWIIDCVMVEVHRGRCDSVDKSGDEDN